MVLINPNLFFIAWYTGILSFKQLCLAHYCIKLIHYKGGLKLLTAIAMVLLGAFGIPLLAKRFLGGADLK